jgi:hypothetical protein
MPPACVEDMPPACVEDMPPACATYQARRESAAQKKSGT